MTTNKGDWVPGAILAWDGATEEAPVKFVDETGEWLQWDAARGVYAVLRPALLKDKVRDVCRFLELSCGKTDLAEFLDQLEGHSYTRLADWDVDGGVDVQNGLLDLGNKRVRPHDVGVLHRRQCPVMYLGDNGGDPWPTPAYDQVKAAYPAALATWENAIHAVLLGDHSAEAMLFCVGPTHSGKGTIFQLVAAFFGAMDDGGWCAFTPLNKMGRDFGMSAIVGAHVLLNREQVIGELGNTTVAWLKDLVTHEGPLPVRLLYRPSLPARSTCG